MSVDGTDGDSPRFFVGCEDGESDEILDPVKLESHDYCYGNPEEEEDDDDDEEYDSPPERQIIVGICAMAKKSKSKPMKEILERLCLFKYITVVIFEEDVILNEPVDNWPLCDCLISFHSKGFPLDKAVAYSELRKPFVINDLDLQYHIQDRREVYRILKEEGILLPRYAVLNRDPDRPEGSWFYILLSKITPIYYFVMVWACTLPYSSIWSRVCVRFCTPSSGLVSVCSVPAHYVSRLHRRVPASVPSSLARDLRPCHPVYHSRLVIWIVCFNVNTRITRAYEKTLIILTFIKAIRDIYISENKVLLSSHRMELRCVIAVIRHGDRTPKQKMKMEVRHQRFFDLFEKYEGYKTGKLKLKKPKQLQEVLDTARQLLVELGQNNDSEIEESKAKLEQLKTVLEMYGHFSGINRKVQLTYLPHGCPKTSSEEEDNRRDDPSLLLVLKWGGELTPAGRVQAEELGRAFRCMYPGGQGDYAGFPGCGLLRLHSTYRHDLKIYASDEGRVQMTAAAFAKGLLALEGELTPILVQMVKSANMNGLLDSEGDSLSSCQQRVKARLHEILQRDRDFTAEDYEKLAPTASTSLIKSMQMIKNPVKTCDKVYSVIQSLTSQIRQRMEDPKSTDIQLYHSETLELMLRRWAKLEKDFKMKNGRYDISKIPDIYDCIKYDVQHNCALKLDHTMELYRLSKALADIVIPQEYGIAKAEKLDIAKGYCTPLIRKIRSDLQRTQDDDTVNKLHPVYSRGVMSPERHVRTRLYFTSESHVHSLLSILRYGALCDENKDDQWKRAMDYLNVVSELNYMTQIVIMLYEDPSKDVSSDDRFHVELHFSPGAKGCEEDKNLPSGFGYRPASRESDGYKKKSQNNDSDEELASSKRDEPDRSLMMFRPMVSDPIFIHRKSPLPRSKKIGSVEVLSENSSHARIARLHAEQKHAGIGFELYSMVPSICPLETLHNSLSLKQVDEFLASVAASSNETFLETPTSSPASSVSFGASSSRKSSLNTYTPAKILPSPFTQSMNKATSMGAIGMYGFV
uniref:Inositol hexakisphosphate and diphosphoinositol-pentakisphosphate kinase n=1 Tax=Erpetoichthys calabaricus TaxID=27687 RepID=A0A8C4RZS8_ERPCA